MEICDVIVVLVFGGPPKILVEIVISRDEEILALIYEDHTVMSKIPHRCP